MLVGCAILLVIAVVFFINGYTTMTGITEIAELSLFIYSLIVASRRTEQE